MKTQLALVLGLASTLAACSDYDLFREGEGEDPPDDYTIPGDTGPVLDPDIELSPSSIAFSYYPVNCRSDWEELTIANVGGADLEVSSVEMTGDGRNGFELHPDDLPAEGEVLVVPPGSETTVRVRFSPSARVEYAPRVAVTSNDPDEEVSRTDVSGEGADDPLVEESFEQDLLNKVDVLWIVDNSGSMSGDLVTVGNNFNDFIQVFIDYDLDYQVGVITTDVDDPSQSGNLVGPYVTPSTPDPVGTFVDQIDLGSSGSATEKGFEAMQLALTEPLLSGNNAGFMREGAALAAIVVTDEDNSSSQSANSFVNWFEALKPDPALTTFSAICEQLFVSCSKYASAADATGGITGDIASSDYSTIMDQIALTTAGMTVSFDLESVPSDLSRTVVTVEGTEVPNSSTNGWIYDTADQAIVFTGAAVPEPGESGTIVYPVAGECP